MLNGMLNGCANVVMGMLEVRDEVMDGVQGMLEVQDEVMGGV